MTRKIINASYTDYLFLFGDFRTAFSDLSAKSAEKCGKQYIMMENDYPVGYICTENDDFFISVIYAYTIPNRRNCRVFSELLQFITSVSNRDVRLNITKNRESFAIVVHVLKKLNFSLESTCIVFSGKSDDFGNWERYMKETGDKFCKILVRQGYKSVSFTEADNSLIENLNRSKNNDFNNHLDIKPYLDRKSKCLDKDMSFMAVKDNIITAYTLVRRPDQTSAVFEHISVHEKYIGSGCILLPFAGSMEMFKEFGCRRAAYVMYENNIHANAFRKKLLKKVTSTQKRSYNYIYHIEENSHYE